MYYIKMGIKDTILKKIPPQYRFAIVNAKNRIYGGFRQTYYAQHGEDVFLKSFFRGQNNGFYVDIGANHPKRYSNTYLLHKKGWHGINVDPNPFTIQLFSHMRPHDINIACGVSNHPGELTYYMFSDPACNTFSEEFARSWEGKQWINLVEKRPIQTVPLRDILHAHVPPHQSIDLLTVDAEGLDIEVLESNDWDAYRPRVVMVEDVDFDAEEPTASKLYTFLHNKQYRLKAVIGPTLIFLSQ